MTFKLHPLHTLEQHSHWFQYCGVLGYHKMLEEGRQTGRSTALAFQYIGEALDTPHRPIPLHDHQHRSYGTETALRAFAQCVEDLVSHNNLQHLHVYTENGQPYIRFGSL